MRPRPGAPFGVVRIQVGMQINLYFLQAIPCDLEGRGFALTKLDREEVVYHVLLAGPQSTCDCKGFLQHSHCKHMEGLLALVEGKASGPDEN
jgi:hypothetical protein